MAKVTKVITAENSFTDYIEVGKGGVTIMIGNDSSFSGTITLQANTEDFTNPIDNVTYTGEVIDIVNPAAEVSLRIGCKTGDFTSGSIKVAIYRNVI